MERWKDIKGWEQYYEVSDAGNVRNKETGHLLVGDKNNSGYYRVCLYRKGHEPAKQRFFRHRLVATHFIPNPHGYPDINHKDMDKSNNTVSNLEWVTEVQNEIHSRINGSKSYKPCIVEYQNGAKIFFHSTAHVARELGLVNRTVVLWAKKQNRGFLQHGIRSIEYVDVDL